MNATVRNRPELLMGLGIIAIGIVIGVEATGINVSPIYAKVGPAAFLWFSAALLALCGGLVGWHGYKTPAATGNELYGPAVIMAGLAVAVIIMEPLGFVPTAAVIFVLTAHGLGSRRLLRDLLIGIALSAIAYFVFSKGLGLRLPTGSLFI